MSQNLPEFRSGAISPMECIREGYALIKDRYWLFLGITFVGLIIGGLVPIVIIGPMMCGIYLCLFTQMRGEEVKFETLFKGFDFFVASLIATLIQFIPMIIVILPVMFVLVAMFLGLIAATQGDPAALIGMLFVMFILIGVIMLVAMLIQGFFFFMYPLIVDKKLSGVDAVKTSFYAVKANFAGVFGVILLNFGLTLLGVLCCYIGAFLVLPVTMASHVITYRKVFPEGLGGGPVAPQWQY